MIAKTQKSLKRYAELATGLKNNNFLLWIKIRIAVLFTLILALFYFVAYIKLVSNNPWADVVMLLVLPVALYTLVYLAIQQIKKGMQSQKRFISSASHELRTPLSIIKANSELVLMDKEGATKEELLELLESNVEEVDRMTDILTTLLHIEEQFNDVEAKSSMLGEVNLSQLVNDVLLSCEKLTQKKNIKVNLNCEGAMIAQGNSVKLKGVVFNIFHNAISYTPNNGYVNVSLSDSKNGLINFIVEDNGIGIPKEDLPHIFNPFYRAKYAENNGYHGVGGMHFGLGLSMAKKVVKEHNGHIAVKSNEGRGTRVEISLPTYR